MIPFKKPCYYYWHQSIKRRVYMANKLLNSWQTRIFILCWTAYACIYLGRVNLSIAIPNIQTTFGWDKSTIGIIGSLFFWTYGIGQMINGYIGDKLNSRLLIFAGLIVTSVSNILFGFSYTLIAMCLLWSVNGYFQSMLWGPMTKTLTFWFDEKARNKVIIGISTSMVGGYVLAWGISSKILTFLSWNWAFWIPGMMIMVFSIVWLAGMRNHPSEAGISVDFYNDNSDNTNFNTDKNYTLLMIIKESKLIFVIIACLAQGIVKDSISLWGPTLLMEKYGLDLKSNIQLIMFIPFMNLMGIFIAAKMNTFLKNKEKLTINVLFLIGLFFTIILCIWKTINSIQAVVVLGLASSMMFGANTLLLGVIPMKFASFNKVSSIAGFLDFCSYAAAGTAGSLTGHIADNYGWNYVLIVWISVTLLGVISLFINYIIEEQKITFKYNEKI
jgi:sugar phosphate permease